MSDLVSIDDLQFWKWFNLLNEVVYIIMHVCTGEFCCDFKCDFIFFNDVKK